jgi:uncharacterized membrane protein (DUF106 family)
MITALLISLVLAVMILWGIHRITASKSDKSASYRIYLILFFSVWSLTLWIRPHRPGMGLLIVSAGLIALVFILALVPRRAPKNRQETKLLIEQLQIEHWLNKLFQTPFKFVYWAILCGLVWSVLLRLVLLYKSEILLLA